GSVSMPVKSKPAEKFLPFPSRMMACKEFCSAESSTPCNSSTSSDDKAFRFSGRFSLICNTVASCPTTSRLFTLQLPGGQRGLQFSVVLSQCRRPHTRLLGLAIQAYGRHEAARPLPVRQVKLLDPLHMLNLRIGQDFGIGVDGCAGHPCRPEYIEPMFTALVLENIFQYQQQFALIFCPVAWRSEPVVAQ